MEVAFGVDVNLLWLVLFSLAVFTSIGGVLVNFAETLVPDFLSASFFYGKTSHGRSKPRSSLPLLLTYKVPKSLFTHFYVFASAYNLGWWAACLGVYVLEVPLPQPVSAALDFLTTRDRREATTSERALLVMTLLLVQSLRRLYECLRVHVFSPASQINFLHYSVGFAHYACVAPAFLSEAPGFTPGFTAHEEHLKGGIRWVHVDPEWGNLVTAEDVALVLLFLWASVIQHRAFRTLAGLRNAPGSSRRVMQAKKGIPSAYGVPVGGGFDLVSCPHYAAEVVIYVCFAGLLGLGHRSGMAVLLWVGVNQVVAALMSHFWYQDNFVDYPKSRKAIIPYIL